MPNSATTWNYDPSTRDSKSLKLLNVSETKEERTAEADLGWGPWGPPISVR